MLMLHLVMAVQSGWAWQAGPRTARRAAAQASSARRHPFVIPRSAHSEARPETVPLPEAFLNDNEHYLSSMEEYRQMYAESLRDPAGFWSKIAQDFHWETPFPGGQAAMKANFDAGAGPIQVEWFKGGTTNLCFNALDRWVEAGKGDQPAFFFEANDEDPSDDPLRPQSEWSYAEVLAEVSRVANWLKAKGVQAGDVVTIFMPMVPQLPIAMLACARIGAVHSVVFGGFSSEALAARLVDAGSKVVITADGVMRGTKVVPLQGVAVAAASIAAEEGLALTAMLTLARLGPTKLPTKPLSVEETWNDVIPAMDPECPVVWMDAEAPLFLLYTSGSTGKPKGVEHTCGGYMVYTATTFKYIFDVHPDAGDVWFSTSDCGWITGHSYVTYGPMLNGAAQVIFEGVPTFPDVSRLWRIVDKRQVTQLYTAPTAVRSLMRFGDDPLKSTRRDSLKLLGSVGEPINPEAWRWFYDKVGNRRAPIADTYWQTETGGVMMAPLPVRGWPVKPGSCTLPFFGVKPVLLTKEGVEIPDGPGEGLLAIKQAWPGTIRGVRGDEKRLQETYFPFPGYYLTGDGCRRDADGLHWITGRVDDVINVSGHRIGTAEIESSLVRHPHVAEAAAVGFPHDVKGEAIYVYVTLNEGVQPSEQLRQEMIRQVRANIGPFASPDTIHWANGLPKTRSGKIMRRILRKIATLGTQVQPEDLGDTSTLADPSVVGDLIASFGQ